MTPAILIVGVLFSCTSNKLDKVLEFSHLETPPARSTTDVTYTYTDSGRVKNILEAGQLDQYQTADSSYSKISDGFAMTFFDNYGEFDGKLTARKAYIGPGNKIMVARDSVIFRNKEGETLHTEELTWYQDSARVYTDKFVTIERKDDVIYGKGLTSNQNFTNYSIQQVTGEFYIEDEANDGKQE